MNPTHQEKNVQKWFEIIKDYLKSGLDKESYCEKHDIDAQRLIYWLGRYYEVSRDLIPATISNPNTSQMIQPQNACNFKLVSGNEISLNNSEALTPELMRLIRVLAMPAGATQ
jgi:hypothetical protein